MLMPRNCCGHRAQLGWVRDLEGGGRKGMMLGGVRHCTCYKSRTSPNKERVFLVLSGCCFCLRFLESLQAYFIYLFFFYASVAGGGSASQGSAGCIKQQRCGREKCISIHLPAGGGGGELINAWQRSAPRGGERGGVMGRGAAPLLPGPSTVLQGINPRGESCCEPRERGRELGGGEGCG